ncbi:unnamed protein product [Rotaria socialis]|uniref:DUF4062 domain-containing protein n=1 Tax=Rotaria socialis TaxID=392032 RepID=A0A818APC2_9BILA|nr:unnamed protein product [Rotaria socialis]
MSFDVSRNFIDKSISLYRGDLRDVPEQRPTSVRVFISSTFTDTIDERDSLIRIVYPKLQKYCLETYNVQFHYSDMRWGIPDQSINDHSTEDMCLQELDRCCQLSLATNCVILLSHRYGGRMLPVRIREHLFNELQTFIFDEEDKSLLNTAYRLDTNQTYLSNEQSMEYSYVLLPVNPEAKTQWKKDEKRLQEVLRYASARCFENKKISENERNEFHISTTAKEIYRALQNNEHRQQRMVVFLREIEDIACVEPDLKSKFTDEKFNSTEGSNVEAQKFLAELKTYIKSKLSEDNIFTYKVHWKDESSKREYLNEFLARFYQVIKDQIDYHIKRSQSKDALYTEALEHAIRCKMFNKNYSPREDIMQQIKDFVLSNTSGAPCILHGDSGTGKSSIMAQIPVEVPNWFRTENNTSISVVIRFLGTTSFTSDIRRPLVSIIQQICTIYGFQKPIIHESNTLQDIKADLEKILEQIPTKEKLILLFDSIDQLRVEDYDCSMWLPVNYPNNVKCIVSTIPNPDMDKRNILEGLKSLCSNATIIEVTKLDENLAQQVIEKWLQRDNRSLTQIQRKWLLSKLEPTWNEPTPLYLSLLYDISLGWHSFDDDRLTNLRRIGYTRDAIDQLYDQLSKKHGEVIFRRAITYVQLSGGLSETELLDMLSADDKVLKSVFVHYLPPPEIFRLPNILWIRIRNDMHKYLVEMEVDGTVILYFYHRSFRYHKAYHYYEKDEVEVEWILRAYYAGHTENGLNLNTLPYEMNSQKLIKKYNIKGSLAVNRCLRKQQPYVTHDKKSGVIWNMRRINQLYMLIRYPLCTPYFLQECDYLSSVLSCPDHNIGDILRACVGHMMVNRELRFLLRLCESCSTVLSKHRANFAFEISSRLAPLVTVLPEHTYNFLQECLNKCKLYWLDKETRTSNPCVNKYSIEAIYALKMYPEGLFILVSGKIRMYFVNGNIEEYAWPFNEEFRSLIAVHSFVCIYSTQAFLVYNFISREVCMVQMDMKDILHMGFVSRSVLLLCSKHRKSIDFYEVREKKPLKNYEFENPIIECDSVRITTIESLVKVTLETDVICYLHIKPESYNIIKKLKKKSENESILLNDTIDVHYDIGQSFAYLYHLKNAEDFQNDSFQRIDDLPSFSSRCHRVACHQESSTGKADAALVWFDVGTAVVLHSCESNDTLSIYEISTFSELKFETRHVQHDVVKVHAIKSSFLIVNGTTRELFSIENKRSLKLKKISTLRFECRSVLTTVMPVQSKLFILSDDYSTLAICHANKTYMIQYVSTLLDSSMLINNIHAVSAGLVLHCHDQQIFLWKLDDSNTRSFLGRARHFQTKNNRIVLYDDSVNKLIVYDTIQMLRGTIQVPNCCDALCFSEDTEYLFVIDREESMLLMYQVNNGKCLEKLFIENLSAQIQTMDDRLVLLSNDEMLLISIAKQHTSYVEKNDHVPSKGCALFEEQYWICCHKKQPWVRISTDNDNSNISSTLASSSDLPLNFDNDYLNILHELNKLADVHLPCVDGHPYVDFVKKLRTMSDGTQILIYTPCRLKNIFERLLYFDFIDQDIYIFPLLASRVASTNTVYS